MIAPEVVFIIIVCLAISGRQCHKLGEKRGIKGTIEHLVEQGRLEVAEDEI